MLSKTPQKPKYIQKKYSTNEQTKSHDSLTKNAGCIIDDNVKYGIFKIYKRKNI